MATSQQLRVRFRDWLTSQALDPEIADAIMETVPPFDWSEISTSSEVSARFEQVDARFEQIDARFEQIDARFEQIDTRFEQIDTRFEQVDARLVALESRVGRLEIRLDHIGTRLDGLHDRVDGLRDELHSMNRTVAIGAVGFTLSMVLATGTMAGTLVASGALS